jgi:spermidine synthase
MKRDIDFELYGRPYHLVKKVQVPEGKSGHWSVSKFTVTKESRMHFLMGIDGMRAPDLGRYTRLTHKLRGTIMSDTSAEMRDHYHAVGMATGSVLIMGLGLGMYLAAVLRKKHVTDVTVIEHSKDVLKLVAPTYKDKRLTIIHANAFEWRPPAGKRYNCVWHDIWDSICIDNNEQMKVLSRRYGRLTDWQGCWGRESMRRYC